LFDKKNLEAYILIVVEHGAEHQVLEALMKFDGVEEGSLVYGEFDIHCKIVVESMENLREVHDKIRKLRILTSETLIAYERAPRKGRSVRNHHVRKLGHKRARH
jgi:DNA-binding Lrp family transcriptional regulator